jgi:5-formyltetrahydrofolate cyclo-ligase
MMFAPVSGEPNLRPLAVDILRRGRLCLPRVDWVHKRMAAASVRDLQRDLVMRRNNIREPVPECPEVPPAELDLILVPGLGFDRSGRRLGRGGGFYDRFLAEPSLRAIRCGVLFDAQLVDQVPAEPHDILVDYLATPSQLWKA